MTTNTDVFEAVIDAVIADPTISQGVAQDAVRTVATINVNNAEAKAWLDELQVVYESIGVINTAAWVAFRNEIVNEGKLTSMALFTALQSSINGLVSSEPINFSVRKQDLREERDTANANIDRLIVVRDGETERQVKDSINIGISELRAYKQRVIDELQSLGDAP